MRCHPVASPTPRRLWIGRNNDRMQCMHPSIAAAAFMSRISSPRKTIIPRCFARSKTPSQHLSFPAAFVCAPRPYMDKESIEGISRETNDWNQEGQINLFWHVTKGKCFRLLIVLRQKRKYFFFVTNIRALMSLVAFYHITVKYSNYHSRTSNQVFVTGNNRKIESLSHNGDRKEPIPVSA